MKTLVLDINKQYSYADYITWTDGIRREIINGVVKVMSGVTDWHNVVTINLPILIKPFIRMQKKKYRIFHAPFDVMLPINGEVDSKQIYTVVQPDFGIVCDFTKVRKNGVFGAPDMIAEVLSPSTAARDLDEKKHLYERVGVKEYWVIYPKEMAITVFLLQSNGKYNEGETFDLLDDEDKKIKVAIIEGLEINLKDIFSEY
jgi:Uma2 family endonuclease